MKNNVLITIIFLALFYACASEKKGDPSRFKKGTFEIPASDAYGKTIIIRKDSLQIEEYTEKIKVSNDSLVGVKEKKRIDTLYIKWKNNFSYTLRMKTPSSELDKDPIFVQITKVTNDSYEFTARIGYSKFRQNGVVYKIK